MITPNSRRYFDLVELYVWHDTSSNAATDSSTKLAWQIGNDGTRPQIPGLVSYGLEEIIVSYHFSTSIHRVYKSYWEYERFNYQLHIEHLQCTLWLSGHDTGPISL